MEEFDPTPGLAETLEPGLRRILAPNPSPMTFRGTNTYLLGEGRVAVIDPGPDRPGHLEAILAALAPGETVSHILVTHSHVDHSPLARPLALATGAPVCAFGDSRAGMRADMAALSGAGVTGGGEGVDRDFRPDETLADGEEIAGDGWRVTALWTPGHMGNHMSFAWGDAVFSGDHVMGWASSMVSPPDGDLTAFMASCRRLAERADRVFYPGHGAPVPDPAARLGWLTRHRETRTAQLRAALAEAPGTVPELTVRIYTDIDPRLLPAAERNVFAHLIDLARKGEVTAEPELALAARFALA